jgi:general L-amino acid transport system permease protein
VQAATHDAQWRGLSKEAYVFAAATYFVFCFSMSRYSIYLERKLHTGHKR